MPNVGSSRSLAGIPPAPASDRSQRSGALRCLCRDVWTASDRHHTPHSPEQTEGDIIDAMTSSMNGCGRPGVEHTARRRTAGSLSGLILLFVCVSACASGGAGAPSAPGALPANRGFDGGTSVAGGFTNRASSMRDSVVLEPRNRIWSVLPDVFRRLEIETPTVDAGSYTIGNPGSRVVRIAGTRLSTFLDCGVGILGPNADRYEVNLQLMVQLGSYPTGGTLVRTTLDAYARPRDTSGDPLHCASQRTLEARIMQMIEAELSGESMPPTRVLAQGRVPVAGDLLRVECVSPVDQDLFVGEGTFLGANGGDLLLGIGRGSQNVGVPVVNLGSVQVRERRSQSRVAGFFGALLGGVGGGFVGKGWYDPENEKLHYPSGVFMTAGVLLGGISGYLTGRIVGSFIKTNVWIDAPQDWALGYSGETVAPGPAAAAGAIDCPSFQTDGS